MLVELNDAFLCKFVFASIPFLNVRKVSQKKRELEPSLRFLNIKILLTGLNKPFESSLHN